MNALVRRGRAAAATVLLAAVVAAAAADAGTRPAIVGRWSRTTTCQGIVAALAKAGLRPLAPAVLAGNGLVPGTAARLAAKPHICSGSVPRVHSHFFTADGRFGSVDWRDRQVDDGRYRVVGDTVHLGSSVFRFAVAGKRLTLTPLVTPLMKRRALSHPLVFSTAGWMIAVSLPGGSWQRIPCAGWC